MLDVALAWTLRLVATYGVGALFVAFVLEGAMVGKVIPTKSLFVAVVVAVGTGWVGLLSPVGAAVLGATVGQCLLFGAVRYTGLCSDRDWSEGRFSVRARRLFDRWGPLAVAVSNALPVVRGSLTVPMALSDGSGARFSAMSFAGSAVYVGALTGLAVGVDSALSLV